MDFKDAILGLADRIKKQKDAIQTEEGTKNAFIMPMIAALEYDIFNPFEVVPEMDCDLTKKGDKLDYAIMKDERAILLIECKHCKQNLNLHSTQLSKYYAASNARFGVLTNGVEYRFYTDLDKMNIMDEKPFLVINLLDLSDTDIEQLRKFSKSSYNESEILCTAKELQIAIQIKDILSRNFQYPGDEFTRYFVKCINEGKSSQKLIEQYKPIVKRIIESIINDSISSRTKITVQQVDNEDVVDDITDNENAILTQERLDAYNIIKDILKDKYDVNEISYTSFKSYLLLWIGHEYWWICRISLKSYSKRICFITEDRTEYKWIQLQSINDLKLYAESIRKAFDIAFRNREQYNKEKHHK